MKALKTAVVLFCAVIFSSGCHHLMFREKITTPKVIDGFSSPESIISGRDCKYFYVSNVGEKLEPSVKDGDGYISRLKTDGIVVDKKFLPKDGVLDSPKGMAIIKKTLYVADVDRVVGFSLDTRDKVFELDFSAEKTVFLNDLAVIDDNTLALSSTDTNKVYKITLGEKPSFSVMQGNIAGPNGLYFDKKENRLFVVGFGEGNKMNGELGVILFADGKAKYKSLTGPLGALDGVALANDERVIFSDWVEFGKPGVLWSYDLKTGALKSFQLSEEVKGPADFYYDRWHGTIWMPMMTQGKVLVDKIK
ncbi:hypothetical protein EPN18_05010 [bacterium]|nr:MAG: hypothetical protein EPN18_05010 [bacterium]